VCLGYPLRSPKGAVRDEPLLALSVPILFVQGTRDALCPLELLDEVRGRMSVPTRVHIVDDGDHSLNVARRTQKASGLGQADYDAAAFEAVAGFVAQVTAG
jgi:predicted alpha/beta-hydrolase family hydrolase